MTAERRPRLAVVTDAVAPWNRGGKEQRAHELLTRLAARGVQVDVYTMRWWQEPGSVERDGITYHAICPLLPLYTQGRRSIRQAVVFAVSTLRVATRDFDVLEVDAIPFVPLFPARVVAWLRRRPMVVTWHEYWGSQYWTQYLGPLGRLAAAVERAAIWLPDRIVAASEGTAQRLRDVRTGAFDVQVVTPGIKLGDDLVPAPVHGTGPDDPRRPLRLISAGRVLDHKKVDVAIRAVGLLAQQGVDARLTVVGEGPALDALHAVTRELGLDSRVDFVAFLPEHRDVLDAMAEADLLLFPTVREGFGMVALESMAMGTPVITSDHPDNYARHVVVDGVSGAVCAPDAEAVAAAVRTCRPRLAELSAGALRVAAGYDWERVTDRAQAAYADYFAAVRRGGRRRYFPRGLSALRKAPTTGLAEPLARNSPKWSTSAPRADESRQMSTK